MRTILDFAQQISYQFRIIMNPEGLNISTILKHIQMLKSVVGPAWIDRKLEEEKSKTPPGSGSLVKYSYIYNQPNHPLIDSFLQFEKWRYVGRLEIGRHDPQLSTLYRLAKALNVSVGQLVD